MHMLQLAVEMQCSFPLESPSDCRLGFFHMYALKSLEMEFLLLLLVMQFRLVIFGV